MAWDQFAVSVADGVVRLEGEIDSYVAPDFDKALHELPGSLTIDCSAVTFLDSAGLSVLIRHYRQRCEQGESLRLVEVSRPVRQVLELTQLLTMFTGGQNGDVATAPLVLRDERPELDPTG